VIGMGLLTKGFDESAGFQEYARPADWRRAIWTRRRRIIVLFFAFLLTSLVAANLMTATYRAQAVLEVLPERQPNAPANPMTLAAADAVVVNTEAEKVGAEPVVRSVFKAWESGTFGPVSGQKGEIKKLIARAEDLFGEQIHRLCAATKIDAQYCPDQNAMTTEEERFSLFQRHLKVAAERETRLIKVTFTAPDPDVAAKVANAIVSEYLNRHADQIEMRSSRYVSWLQGRINTLGRQAAKSDEAVARYRGQTGLIEMANDATAARRSPAVEELEHALQNASSAEATTISALVRLNTLREVRRDPNKIKTASELVGSKLINDLTVQLSVEQAKVASLLATYAGDSALAAKARAQIAAIQGQINQEVGKLLDAAERDYSNANDVMKYFSDRIERLKAKIAEEQIERVSLNGLERQANADSDLYTAYLRQAREAIEAVKWQNVAASVTAGATPPVEPMFPHNRLFLPFAILGSALAATVVSALQEVQHQRRVFSDPMDFGGLTGVRVIGAIPKLRRTTRAYLPVTFRASIEGVAFRLSRSADVNLAPDFALSPTPLLEQPTSWGWGKSMTITVTSAVSGEGKSMLATALATQFLKDGARTLIIDADLRRPGVVKALKATNDCPVTSVMCMPDGSEWNGFGKQGLHVLTLVNMGGRSTAILAALPRLISNLKLYYDIVFIDTPPLLVFGDALAAISRADRTILAVKWCSTDRQAVEMALGDLSEIERARTRIVLTNVENGTLDARYSGGHAVLRGALRWLGVRKAEGVAR
jgi:succinoglycan biosynthesis transport protein ExoP